MDEDTLNIDAEKISLENKLNGRLTNKYAQTLEILHDLTTENKLSSGKIQDLEAMMEEKQEMERELKETILQLRHEIEALRAANQDLRDTAVEENHSNEVAKNLMTILKENEQYIQENACLKEELGNISSDLDIIKAEKATDMVRIKELMMQYKHLLQDFQEVQQRFRELEFQLDKAKDELEERSKDQESIFLIESLRDKVKLLSREQENWIDREIHFKKCLQDLQVLKDEIKEANVSLQSQHENLLMEYGYLNLKYEKLQKSYAKEQSKKNFQDFVALKRQYNSLKDENEELKAQMDDTMLKVQNLPQSLPHLLKKDRHRRKAEAKSVVKFAIRNDKRDNMCI